MPWLRPTIPVSRPSTDAQRAFEVPGEDVGDQPVLGVVGGGDRLLLVGEGVDRRDRDRRSPPVAARRCRSRPPARSAHRSSRRHRARYRRSTAWSRPCRSRPRPAWRPCRAACRRSAGRPRCLPAIRARRSAWLIRKASFSVNSSATPPATWKRLAAVQASPPLRILASIAPSTAASTSASSKTRNGALPPSSIERRSRVLEAWLISWRPTARGTGEGELAQTLVGDQRSRWCSAASEVLKTLSTPAGRPACSRISCQREHRQRGQVGRLDDHRAAGGDRGTDLAGAHRQREVPGGDEQARSDGLASSSAPVRRRWPRPSRCRRSGPPPRRTSGRTRLRR